jgi:hypothetical protein
MAAGLPLVVVVEQYHETDLRRDELHFKPLL